ncbi:hypothetical protein G6F37_001469 [Rhizopus arrhizus]|nr:hypothetical protein G6F38_005233 [Rhizopus arrhizus]KAG1163152.1 hypothetical protein G6F37_001469 [Rhizopus arrhizus]
MDELIQEARFYKLNDLLKLKWQKLPTITQKELHDLYPLHQSNYVIFNLQRKDLSNLNFSGYHIDPRSSFAESNLENAQFDQAQFGFDFDHQVDFRNTYLIGATFPQEGTVYRATGIEFRLEGAII